MAPYLSRAFPKLLKAGEVANDPIIPEVAPQLLRELLVLFLDRRCRFCGTTPTALPALA